MTIPKNFRLFLFLLFILPFPADAMLRIEVCGGATDERACKPGVDEITTDGSAGKVVVGCAAGETQCQVQDVDAQLNAKSALPTPPGWTPPVPPSIEPSPPSSAATGGGNDLGAPPVPAFTCGDASAMTPGQIYYQAAQQRYWGVFSNGAPLTYPIPAGFSAACTCGHSSISNCLLAEKSSPLTCPSGYTLSGSTCNLSNASQVQKPSDGRCTIKRDGNSFSADPRDPDCAVAPGITVSGSSLTINPVSGSVENKIIQFVPDGSGSITSSTPNADGTTTQRTVTFGPPNVTTGQSVVTGTGERIFKGTGDQQGAPIGELPTDYNREPTQQQIKSGIDDLNAKLDATGVDSTLSAEKTAFDVAADAHEDLLETATSRTSSGLDFTFGFPSPGACSPLQFAIPGAVGRTLTIDWCVVQEPIKSIGSFIVWLFASLYLFGLGTSIFRST